MSADFINDTNPLPTIRTNPVSQTALPGGSVTFNVTAGTNAPVSYQWLFNGTNIAGATNSTLVLTGVQLADVGPYLVLVTNTFDVITSSPAMLLADPAYVKLKTASRGALSFLSWIGVPLGLEWSGDLKNWYPLTTLTNLGGTLEFFDDEVINHPHRFYRTVVPPDS